MRPAIILFARAPVPGRVKTRLCPFLNVTNAAALHSALVRDALELLQKLSGVADIELSTDVETDAWQEFAVARSLQGQGDLGDRLFHAFASALGAGRPKAMVVGSDSPGLPAGYLAELLRSDTDAAMGPTEDGGFYAIACRRIAPGMLDGVRWSSSNTLEDTKHAIRACSLTAEFGQPWFDIDEPPDLLRLRTLTDLPRHTAAWLASNEVRLSALPTQPRPQTRGDSRSRSRP
ncbi:MAG: TIGR04282 family arsenosugar biosynthesis glycosyltransferase [Bryobacteraceae bacterium]|jgi:hypothetical protein